MLNSPPRAELTALGDEGGKGDAPTNAPSVRRAFRVCEIRRMVVAAIHRNRVQGLEAKTRNTAKRRSAQKRAREARDDPLGVLRAVAAAEALWDFQDAGMLQRDEAQIELARRLSGKCHA